ncbi:MAG TPA: helix-turn-helix domain-containing protein [Solirubrobacteraceae bacterium]|jgi:AcrR family transcriptional regulator|nr:helix-turn-helix domain-containing protein [Solirubrobacteraceae bacterium]
MSTTAKPLRADARRNRESLLAAASELFAQSGTDVPLEAVSARAGVGIATLYRNFPTRDALVEAAYRSEVAHITAAAAELLVEHPADIALERWTERYLDYVAAKRGMSGALRAIIESGNDIYAETRGQLLAALATLLQAGVDAGSLRADIDAEDVFRATGSVFLLPQEDGWREQAARLLGLIVDGLRYGAPDAQPR